MLPVFFSVIAHAICLLAVIPWTIIKRMGKFSQIAWTMTEKKTDNVCYPGKMTDSMCYPPKKADSMRYHEKNLR